jgi:MoxR-like ATPase
MKAAKAFAAMDGRPVISEEDVKRAVKPVLRHRIGLNYRAQASKMAADDVIDAIVEDVYARG